MPRLLEHHIFDDGDVCRAGSGDHEPQYAGNDGRRARFYRVLTCQDPQSTDYVAAYADVQIQTTQTSKSAATVAEVSAAAPGGTPCLRLRRGLKAEARAAADAALTMREPLDVVNTSLIPALDAVGDGFEKGTVFLPQLFAGCHRCPGRF